MEGAFLVANPVGHSESESLQPLARDTSNWRAQLDNDRKPGFRAAGAPYQPPDAGWRASPRLAKTTASYGLRT
jgi:hypothetical protein